MDHLGQSKRAGFLMLAIDRWMRTPYAKAIVPIVAACSIVVALLFYSENETGVSHAWYLLQHRTGPVVFFGGVFAIGGWWTILTWRRLWRGGRDPWERAVYDYGVRTYGLLMSIALIVICAWLGGEFDSQRKLMVAVGAIGGLFFGMPVALNMGYFWGLAFATIMGEERNRDAEGGEPPLLT